MASTLSVFSALASLTLFFILIDPSLARQHNRKQSLKKLCSKTNDHNLCMRLMETNSISLDADYRSLTELAIDLAYAKADEIHRGLKYLIDGRRNYDLREVYDKCSSNYRDAQRDLQSARNLYRDGDSNQIESQIKDAIEEVRHCKDQVRRKESYSSNLENKTREFELLCEIVRVSAKYWEDNDRHSKKN